MYRSIVHEWIIIDNTIQSERVAYYERGVTTIINLNIWTLITDLNTDQQPGVVKEPLATYEISGEESWVDSVMRATRRAYRKLVLESATNNESLVVAIDGVVQKVPAKELLHTIVGIE